MRPQPQHLNPWPEARRDRIENINVTSLDVREQDKYDLWMDRIGRFVASLVLFGLTVIGYLVAVGHHRWPV